MKKNAVISVILPIHNSERYIEETLKSVGAQTFSDIEIICVNDGSTDNTERIIRSFMEKEERITLINQRNQYAGVARNNGMKVARGKYMVFWDADDCFEPELLEQLYAKAEEDQADICVCDAVQFDNITGKDYTLVRYLKQDYLPDSIPFSRKDSANILFNFTTDVPWNKMYRREFVEQHGLQFEDRKRGNDHYFVLLAFALAERITIVDKKLYRYRIDSQASLTSGISSTPMCIYEALDHAYEALKARGMMEDPLLVQSFANRAMSSLSYGLEMQQQSDSYHHLYELLKSTGIPKLCGSGRGREYFYYPPNYERYQNIQKLNSVDYLLLEYARERNAAKVQKAKGQEVKEKLAETKAVLKDCKRELKETTKECGRLRKELDGIYNSRGYQSLQKICRIKNGILGKGKSEE